jgi:hypothetical protein
MSTNRKRRALAGMVLTAIVLSSSGVQARHAAAIDPVPEAPTITESLAARERALVMMAALNGGYAAIVANNYRIAR